MPKHSWAEYAGLDWLQVRRSAFPAGIFGRMMKIIVQNHGVGAGEGAFADVNGRAKDGGADAHTRQFRQPFHREIGNPRNI